MLNLILTSCNPLGKGSDFGTKAPVLLWNNQNYNFGNLNVGSSSNATFTLSNNGNISAIGCSAVQLSDTTNFSLISDNCTSDTMAANQSCEVEISSHPTTVGVKELTISRACADDVIVQTPEAQISVTGVTPVLVWSILSHDFGTVNVGDISSGQAFALQNTGTSEASGCSAPTLSNTTDFMISADACGTANLAAGNSCLVGLRANPQSVGVLTATLSRTCTLGGVASTTSDQIVVTGLGPQLEWAPLSYDYNKVFVGVDSTAQRFDLANNGGADATSCQAPELSNTTDFRIITDTCSTNDLAKADSCYVEVVANPTADKEFRTTLTRNCSNASAHTNGDEIVVTGEFGPILSWDQTDYNFSDIDVGTDSSPQRFRLENSGAADATQCDPPQLTDTTNFRIIHDNCDRNDLAKGDTCDLEVVAQPQSLGSHRTTLSRYCAVGGSAVTGTDKIEVNGTVTSAPALAWSPLTNDFGDVNVGSNSSNMVFTLTNSGTADATGCSAPTLSNSTDFSLNSDTCSNNNLGHTNGSCSIRVRANPQSTGAKMTTLSRTCSVGGTAATTTDQIVTNGVQPNIAWSPLTNDFGSINQGSTSTYVTFTFSNSGTAAATGCSAPSLSNSTDFSLANDFCSTNNIAIGGSCTVQVRAQPQSSGSKTATLSRTCTVGNTAATTANGLTVTATGPTLVWSPLTHGFGNVNIGTNSSTQTFTLSNSGSGPTATCSAPTISDTTHFTIVTDNCGTSNIASSSSCTIDVRANPTTVGAKSATISRTCTVGGTVTTTTNGVTATGTGPTLAWSPLTKAYGNVVVGASASAQTFTLSNSGTGSATGCSAPSLSNSTDFSISVDNCGTNDVANGGSCTVNVVANPASTGAKTATLSRTCTIGGTTSTTTNGLTTTGTYPNLAWSPLTKTYNATVVGSNSTTQVYTLSNSGGTATATGCSAPVISDTTNFTMTSNTCGTNNLNSGSTCTATVRANPQSLGLKQATLSRTCTVGGTPTTTTNGIQVTGILSADWQQAYGQTTFNLVNANINSNTYSYYFRNANNTALTSCVAPALSNTTDFAIVSDGCGTGTMAATSVCEVQVRVSTVTTGAKTSNLTRSCAETATISIALSATTEYAPSAILQVAAGQTSNCALQNDGRIKCWGSNMYGNLGDGTATKRNSPIFVSGISTATQIALNANSFGCALLSDTTVQCWGYNTNGQLGDGTTTQRNSPVAVLGLSNVAQLVSNEGSTCALLTDQTVKCWGMGDYGQLGDGNGISQSTPVTVFGLSNVVEVVGNYYSYCARLVDKTVKCWGYNGSGQLGNGTINNALLPVAVSGLTDVDKISMSGLHTCALISGGAVKCWGLNGSGQLGDGTITDSLVPVDVLTITNAAKLQIAGMSSCAILTDNTIKCWGYNYNGQLGDGTGVNSSVPVTVVGINNASEIYVSSSVASDNYCSLLTDGTVKCWGNDNYGIMNDGTTGNYRYAPVSISGLSGVSSVALSFLSACALKTDLTVKCWGYNANGQLGDGTDYYKLKGVTVPGISSPLQVASGNNYSCALLSDNTVKCWGVSNYNQLGSGTLITQSTPVAVSSLSNAVEIAAGAEQACARINDGTVKCWGSNSTGQIGNGTISNFSSPAQVSGITTAMQITSGMRYSCALLSDNTVKCWGQNNYGQLGDTTTNNRTTPVDVNGLSGVTQISAGDGHVCALLNDATVKCWGNNTNGQLGDGFTTSLTSPVAVSGLSGVSKIRASFNSTCALLTDGTVKCWGANTYGQIGDSTGAQRVLPVSVVGVSGATDISVGLFSACALLSNQRLKCWGYNYYGQLGDFTKTQRSTPVYALDTTLLNQSLGLGSSGAQNYCVTKTDGSVVCYGSNINGQTGQTEIYLRNVSGF